MFEPIQPVFRQTRYLSVAPIIFLSMLPVSSFKAVAWTQVIRIWFPVEQQELIMFWIENPWIWVIIIPWSLPSRIIINIKTPQKKSGL